MNSLPMQLDAVASAHGGLDDFRIDAPAEILSVLRGLADNSIVVNLNGSDGAAYTTTVWSVDPDRGILSFRAEEHSAQVQQLVEGEEAVAVAYLDSIKVQFDLSGLLLVHGGKACALTSSLPRVLYRFQRRTGFRVTPLLRNMPVAKVRHPMIPEMALSLRVLDVSIGGCALFLPDDVPPLQPGVVLNGVQIELGLDTRVTTSLRLQHVTSLNHDAKGVRLGCEIVDPHAETLRALQRYINQTQRRRRALGS
jgi:c-di-GMP-binding flagellar brake protein YcgR